MKNARCWLAVFGAAAVLIAAGCGGGDSDDYTAAKLPLDVAPPSVPAIDFPCSGAFVPEQGGDILLMVPALWFSGAKLRFRAGGGEWNEAAVLERLPSVGASSAFIWHTALDPLLAGRRVADVSFQIKAVEASTEIVGPIAIDNSLIPTIREMRALAPWGVIDVVVDIEGDPNEPFTVELAFSAAGGAPACASARTPNPASGVGSREIVIAWDSALDVPASRNGRVAVVLRAAVRGGRFDDILGAREIEIEIDNRELPPGEFYAAAEMRFPRFEHRAVTLDDGTVLVAGGTDDRCLTSIDRCEVFDQERFETPEPPSFMGGWIDTDFEGEDIRLAGGGRIFHTLDALPEGGVLAAGGVEDGQSGRPAARGELFDPHTRRLSVIDAPPAFPRFHHTTAVLPDGRIALFGGRIAVTIQYPDPSDPQRLREEVRYPTTGSIEVYDPAAPSLDGRGAFVPLLGAGGLPAALPGAPGRALHATVRIAGADLRLGNDNDLYVHAGGLRSRSAELSPETVLRRMSGGRTQLMATLDVYDAGRQVCFVGPGVFLEEPRAHDVAAENLGWHGDRTHDGFLGQSNTFIVFGGSDDNLPTVGRWLTEGFAATYSGAGPGGGVSFVRTDPWDWEISVVVARLRAALDAGLLAEVQAVLATPYGTVEEERIGKYFAAEILGGGGDAPINRVHAPALRLVRRIATEAGDRTIGTIFTCGGGFFYAEGTQVEKYDGVPVAAGELFNPAYNLINAFFDPPRKPYDLGTVRDYWSEAAADPRPLPNEPRTHRHPSGLEGAWLLTDGNLAGDTFAAHQLIAGANASDEERRVRTLPAGRAWHTLSALPGANRRLGDPDDRVLIAGGGRGVEAWGGAPVTPSAVIYVPSE
ncbi:MAG TPA: hypothetical protein PKX48_01490 [Planctomycetota bacterium]|nr:hypothetical protein [Planctomycetota bacterium]OQC22091.1 MAG: hypothetical protein BWX69_00402 [Planctomycetes bacterium ADurb.Bin069]NMD35472.1 hypothetical protein [Planctomycetota bacterium]HNR98026.1 hypothetical protein [Planctomycetota bacterium]HNU25775.1 hypothetical protein [Planctomycetota bacterium]